MGQQAVRERDERSAKVSQSVMSRLRVGRRGNSMLGGVSVRGAGAQQDTGTAGKEKEGKIGLTRNFFFEKLKQDVPREEEPPPSNLLPLPPGARSLRCLALAAAFARRHSRMLVCATLSQTRDCTETCPSYPLAARGKLRRSVRRRVSASPNAKVLEVSH